MTINTIIRNPEVGEVGKEATFVADATQKTGTELRYYLAYAPISSALPTLETLPAADRAKARLRIDKLGRGVFTPDVAGHYQVECHDVTVTKTPQLWNNAPLVPDVDDDFDGAPVITLDTAEALPRYDYQSDFHVAQAVSRTVGRVPHVATLTMRVHERIELRFPDAITLTPVASSRVAAAAVFDDSVIGCLDAMRNERGIASEYHLQGAVSQEGFATASGLRDLWNAHLAHASGWTVHTVVDSTNPVVGVAPSDLAGSLARLATIRASFDAHRVITPMHAVADTSIYGTDGVPDPTDLPSGLRFARLLFDAIYGDAFVDNGGSVFVFTVGHFFRHPTPGDPLGYVPFDFSDTLFGLLRATNELTRRWNLHCGTTTIAAPHASADTDNRLDTELPTTDAALATWVNLLADAIERHTADRHIDTSSSSPTYKQPIPFSPAKHQSGNRGLRITRRATDLGSAIEAMEDCRNAILRHMLDGGSDPFNPPAHAVAAYGWRNGQGKAPIMTRLQDAWAKFVGQGAATPPRHFNGRAVQLLATGWR